MATKKSSKPAKAEARAPQSTAQHGVWQPVYATQEALNAAMNEFREAVSEDIRALADARRRSEELLMKGF